MDKERDSSGNYQPRKRKACGMDVERITSLTKEGRFVPDEDNEQVKYPNPVKHEYGCAIVRENNRQMLSSRSSVRRVNELHEQVNHCKNIFMQGLYGDNNRYISV